MSHTARRVGTFLAGFAIPCCANASVKNRQTQLNGYKAVRIYYSPFSSLARRLIDVRNRNWLPKIESYLRTGKTYFVVVGAGHMGGPKGLLAMLLRAAIRSNNSRVAACVTPCGFLAATTSMTALSGKVFAFVNLWRLFFVRG